MSKYHWMGSRPAIWTGIALAVLLAGCQQNPPAEKSATVEERNVAAGTTPGASTSGTASGNVTGTQTGQGNPLRDPRSILSKRIVFFDYDSYAVKDDYRPLIDAHAKYLQNNRSARMTIQGNCDERGSREYNIALGQRRADAVKRMMLLDGATDQQIETVSFGKEKPRNAGHDETAWAENRRDDFVYAGE
jgi:peptidoglycan-associated lipoprotein